MAIRPATPWYSCKAPRRTGSAPVGRRSGRARTELTALVLATYGNVCHLRMAGCTRTATTKDHIIPYSMGGDDSLENFRPACRNCNSKRGNRTFGNQGAVVKVITGPPAGGKTTWVAERATTNDIAIDLDAIARALMPVQLEHSHTYPAHVRHVAIGARKAAIERATRLRERVTVFIIHAIPTPDELANYRSMHWEVVVCDPGRDVVMDRCRRLRPDYMMPAVDRWYATQAGSLATVAQVLADTPVYDLETAALEHAGMAPPSRDW
jgi:hypothetical protein